MNLPASTHTTDVLDQFGAAPLEEVMPTDASDFADITIGEGDFVVIHCIRDYYGYVLEAENACGRVKVNFLDDTFKQRRTFAFAASTVELIIKKEALYKATAAVSAEALTATV